jgi:hypothetical protein
MSAVEETCRRTGMVLVENMDLMAWTTGPERMEIREEKNTVSFPFEQRKCGFEDIIIPSPHGGDLVDLLVAFPSFILE